MAHAGKTLENPVTRDRITFLKTARDTNGESLELEVVGGGTPGKTRRAFGSSSARLSEPKRSSKRPTGWQGMERDGKLNKQGLPNPLQAAVLAREYAHEIVVPPQREIVLSRLPRPLLTLLIAVGAPLGRVLGYGARYPKYSPD